MRHLVGYARALLRDESGQDLMEYGLLATLIAIVVMTAVGEVGLQLDGLWNRIVGELVAAL
jgi:pilus assembly protein Flp/PilA